MNINNGNMKKLNPDQIELYLLDLYKDILNVSELNRSDNFFDLGGDSISQMEIISSVSEHFAIKLEANSIILNPTIEEFSTAVARAKNLPSDIIKAFTNENDNLLLSVSQKQIWLLHEICHDKAICNIFRAFDLGGDIDSTIFVDTINLLHKRHDALQIRFYVDEGEIKQKYDEKISPDFQEINLESLSEASSLTKSDNIINSEIKKKFNLLGSPLYRLRLIKLGLNRYRFLLIIHHIIADGWSVDLYLKELSKVYAKLRNESLESLPEIKLPFLKYMNSNVGRLQKNKENIFSEKILSATAEPIPLPFYKQRPTVQSYKGKRYRISITTNKKANILEITKNEQTTPYVFLVSVFNILLHYFSGQANISIGTPYANRNMPGVEHTLGFFVEVLIALTTVKTDLSFNQFMGLVNNALNDALQNKAVSYEKMLASLSSEQSLSYNPLFQVMFNFLSAGSSNPFFTDVSVSRIWLDNETSKYDLSLWVWDTSSGYEVVFEYNIELFSPQTIKQLADYYMHLVNVFSINGDQKVNDSLVLLKEDKEKLFLWNKTEESYPKHSLYQLFENQASNTPNANAILETEQKLSYSEIQQQVDNIASNLLARGIKKNDVIAIYMSRSLESIISMLAIWKCGAAFLAIEPDQPMERVRYMITDSKAGFAIVRASSNIKNMPPCCQELNYDDLILGSTHMHRSTSFQGYNMLPTDPAYIIYTSGSTGRPKGIIGTQGNTLNRIHWMWREYPFTNQSIFCQKTSLMFVDSIWEIFGPLLAGTPQIILSKNTLLDLNKLVDDLCNNRITHIIVVPVFLQELLDCLERMKHTIVTLEMCTVSGALLTTDLAKKFFKIFPNCKLLHLYGSAEVGGDVTAYDVTLNDLSEDLDIPVGKPIANTQVLILDKEMNLVPPGVEGEICITGAALSNGYLGAAGFEQSVFIQDSSISQRALFRTGDYGKFLLDGNIKFCGRENRRTKINGIRIELDEIECCIREYEPVKNCAVIVGDKNHLTLIAYLFFTNDTDRDRFQEQLLIDFLSSRLITVMIPNQYIILENFPTLPSGKVDYVRLCKYRVLEQRKMEVSLPTTTIQSNLLNIWRQFFKNSQISITDNFFTLGGNSLQIMRLANAIAEEFGVTIDYKTVFKKPTLVEMAACIEALQRNKKDIVPPIIRRD